MQMITEKPKRQTQRRDMMFVVLGAFFLLVSCTYFGTCGLITDCRASENPTDLELTVTVIVRLNITTEAQLTETASMQGNTASLDVQSTATVISLQQTRLAVTQSALATRQAQIIPTLTAMATSTP